LKSGKLLDLAETEVIVCTEGCQMCSGGWPQDAFEYVMKHKGIPLEQDMAYDGSWLMKLTQARDGSNNELRYVHDAQFEN
jgi:hypothetical protein